LFRLHKNEEDDNKLYQIQGAYFMSNPLLPTSCNCSVNSCPDGGAKINLFSAQKSIVPKTVSGSLSSGFTLIEMAVILVIIGLILFVGVASWQMLSEGRRITRTRIILEEAKDCLIKRMYYTEAYPRFHTGRDASNSSADVDQCLGEKRDAWGHPLRYLGGINATNGSLAGQFIIDDRAENQTAVSPGDWSNAIDKDGNNTGDIAFVLISFGRDGQADHSSYGGRLPTDDIYEPTQTASSTEDDPANPPQFNVTGDDLSLIVTGNELKALLTE
jgi:type II secretory pathway pseudopilin PulG